MDAILRKALRKYNGLRQQVDNVLLGEDGDLWETELRKFLSKRTCWPSKQATQVAKPKTKLEVVSDKSRGYPDWMKKALTPQLEDIEPLDAAKSALWFHPKQTGPDYPTGHEIYKHLLPDQETYQPKEGDMILKCVSLRTLRYYEKNPTLIPKDWKGKCIYAWGSVVLDAVGDLYVPYLDCGVAKPCVRWDRLGYGWYDGEPALVRAS